MKEYLVLGDLHCGSNVSVSTNPKNSIQKGIRKKWKEMVEHLASHTFAGGINLGDNTEGTDYHSMGKYNDTNDHLEQVNMACELLQELPVKKWCVVNGSRYHIGSNPTDDELVADKLGAKYGSEHIIDTGYGRIHASHKVGVSMSATAYRPTPIAREMMLATLNQEEYGKFKVILRGHAHYYVQVRFGGTMGVICPCWKGRDVFAQERTLAMMPHLGYCILQFEGTSFNLEPHLFTLKKKNLISEIKL